MSAPWHELLAYAALGWVIAEACKWAWRKVRP